MGLNLVALYYDPRVVLTLARSTQEMGEENLAGRRHRILQVNLDAQRFMDELSRPGPRLFFSVHFASATNPDIGAFQRLGYEAFEFREVTSMWESTSLELFKDRFHVGITENRCVASPCSDSNGPGQIADGKQSIILFARVKGASSVDPWVEQEMISLLQLYGADPDLLGGRE